MPEVQIFEKICSECKTINYSQEIEDIGKSYARIWFTCKKCSCRYDNWWYGTGPSAGNQPLWKDLLRQPFKAIAMKSITGITLEHIYEALDSFENESYYMILKDDAGKEAIYLKEYFIVDRKKK